MAFDEKGMAVGGTGHDAATMVAALVAAGKVTTVDEAGAAFHTLHASCFDSYLQVHGVEVVASVFSGGGRGGNDEDGSTVLKYGEHAGKTIAALYAENPDALHRVLDSSRSAWLRTRIETFIAAQ